MNKKLLILIIGGFIVGIILAWFLAGGSFNLSDFFRPSREGVGKLGVEKKNEDLTPSSTIEKEVIVKKSAGENSGGFSDSPQNFSEIISVKSQAAGSEVRIKNVLHEESVWIAIYDELNGVPASAILGAGRFREGVDEGIVPLLRKTEAGKTYFAVLHRDNGDNSFDFKSSDPPLKSIAGGLIMAKFDVFEKNDCVISGCSSQICSDQDVPTTCEFLPEYACYKNAVCERQPSGKCDWTKTEELKECLTIGF